MNLLEINGTQYPLRFGMGFLRKINKTAHVEESGIRRDVGLANEVNAVLSGDVVSLVEMILLANETEEPKLTRDVLERYIEDENTNIADLFQKVIDFLSTANVTRQTTARMKDAIMKDLATLQ